MCVNRDDVVYQPILGMRLNCSIDASYVIQMTYFCWNYRDVALYFLNMTYTIAAFLYSSHDFSFMVG